MFQTIDVQQWGRRRAFHFFQNFDDPFFNIAANVDVTAIHAFCKEQGLSFSLACLFRSNQIVNGIEEFRLRLVNGDVRRYDTVHLGATVLHDDGTFSFCYFEMQPDVRSFVAHGRQQIENQLLSKKFDPKDSLYDVIHYSVVPWVSFTGVKHARRFGREDSVPKIVFGKTFSQNGRLLMPVSLEAHHGLMDGFHAGKYFQGWEGEAGWDI